MFTWSAKLYFVSGHCRFRCFWWDRLMRLSISCPTSPSVPDRGEGGEVEIFLHVNFPCWNIPSCQLPLLTPPPGWGNPLMLWHLMHIATCTFPLMYITAHHGKATKQAALKSKFANSYTVLNYHIQIQYVCTSRKNLTFISIPLRTYHHKQYNNK